MRPTVPASDASTPAHRDCDRGIRRKIEQSKRSGQAFDKRRGFSSDMGKSAIDDQKDHAPGSGEQAFQKAMKTEAVTPPIR
jgi:hypothetical protein